MLARTVALALVIQACGSSSPPFERVASVETPPPVLAATAPPSPARLVPTEETLGTAHPIVVQLTADDGSWVAACEARQDTDGDGQIRIEVGHHGELFGDAAALYLFSAAHPEGEVVDRFVTAAPHGRAVAFVRNGHLLVRHAGREIDLSAAGATSAGDGNPTLPDRDADFDAAGERVLYLRGRGRAETLVVRELASGVDREIDTGAGRVWRAEFLGDGQWLTVATVPRDTNGNGRLDLPTLRTTLAGGPCRGEPASFSTHGFDGDSFEWRYVRLRDGHRETRDVRGWAGDALVVRDASGALHWVSASGAEREIVPASCAARFEGMWVEGSAVLVGCGGTEQASPLFVYDARGAHALGMSAPARDDRSFSSTRIFAVSSSFIVDLQQARAFPRAHAGEQAFRGSRVLETVEGGVMRFRDLETGRIRTITGPTEEYVYGREFGRFAAIRHESVLLIDLEEERVAATMPSAPVALRHDGAGVSVLLSAGESDGVEAGPLRWHRLVVD
jgi:hypothetical protein